MAAVTFEEAQKPPTEFRRCCKGISDAQDNTSKISLIVF